jgi:hypothetical protein
VGQEIFYCSGCQTQLRSVDFEKGRAYKLLGLDAICAKCVPDALKALPPEKLQALQKAMAGNSKSGTARVPLATSTPKSGTGRVPLATSTPKSGTGRIPLAATPASTRKIPIVGEEKNLKPVVFVAVAIAIAILAALFALSGRKPSEPGARTPVPSATDIPIPLPASETGRDRTARESLRKAHLYKDANPTNVLEQLRLFQLAADEAKGTGFENDVNKALEIAKRRVQEAAAVELKTLDEQTRDACAKDEFKRATELLEEARRKPVGSEWSGEIDRRIQGVQARVDSAYGRIRTQALIAKPGSNELKALKEKVAKWGYEQLVADLDKSLADAAAPKPAPAPVPAPTPAPAPPDAPKLPPAAEAEAFGKSWSDSLMLAYGRDFSPALQELERISPILQDPLLKSQAAADLEILRGVAALHAEAMQAITRWPVGKKISLNFIDFDNNPTHVEGPLARVRNGTLEINKGKPIPQWPLGHLTARSLTDFAPGRPRVTAAIACLIEGDAIGAKELGGEGNPAIPARYWKWAADVSKPADKETQEKERKARYYYYWAVLNQGAPAIRAEAAMKCRKVLEECASMTWVRRNRAMLTAVADTTRDYVAGPAALRQAGMFRLEVPKSMPYWMCSIDIDLAKRKDNYVEMDFSVLTDATYRAWAYVGACCTESLVFYSQTSDLAGAEPGGEPDAPVKHAMTSATKNHAGHAGRKGPVKWGWVELPLPKYDKPGAKVLRLLTDKQGFSVAWIVVSSLRDKPPGDAESKEWEKEIVHNAGPVAPTIGLAAWFKADAGTAIEAGRVAQWQDQSGHGHHAVQVSPAARPTLVANALNGKPLIRFDGASNVLSFDCPVNGLTSLTIFIVAGASKNQRGNELGSYAALEWPEFGPWGNIFLSPQQTCIAWRCGTGQFNNVSLWERPDTSPKGPSLTTLRKDGSKEELFVQGALALAPKDRLPAVAHTQDVATIGAGTDSKQNPLRYYGGDIAEILVFTRALSEAERDAIERYLRGKYGI